jgi:Tfp pilus assembly protein PilF
MNQQQNAPIGFGAPRIHQRSFSEDPESLFSVGLLLLKKHNVRGAMQKFEEAHKVNPDEARYASYYGLCLAQVEKRIVHAEMLCARAAEKEFFRADLFYNLGRVRLMMQDKRSAHEAFARGLSADRTHRPIIKELRRMGRRGRPVFSFLNRGHLLNKYSGIMLTRLGLR